MFALLVERLERQVLVEQQVVATLAAAGAKEVEMPVLEERISDFEQWLESEPAPEGDPEQAELRALLGVS